ncbi:MAG: hypothetical protein ACE147_16800 [Candidatus Methylomirabilales bacterium]
MREVYQPEPAEVRAAQDAFEAMEKAWGAAQPMFASALGEEATQLAGAQAVRATGE